MDNAATTSGDSAPNPGAAGNISTDGPAAVGVVEKTSVVPGTSSTTTTRGTEGGTGNEPGSKGLPGGSPDDKKVAKPKRKSTPAQLAARKDAADKRKLLNSRIELIAKALEEEGQKTNGSANTNTDSGGTGETLPTGGTDENVTTEPSEIDESPGQADEMDVVDHGAVSDGGTEPSLNYFTGRVRRTRGMHRVAQGFGNFMQDARDNPGGVRLPSAHAMRDHMNFARAPGTTLLDRLSVMRRNAVTPQISHRRVRLPRYADI